MQILKDEIKNAIIEAAVKEFSLRGYEKSSMREIAQSAGISVSNTYHYFHSKEQLFGSLVEPVSKQVKTVFKTTIEQSAEGGLRENKIEIFINNIVHTLLQMDDHQRLLLFILTENSTGTKYEGTKKENGSVIGKTSAGRHGKTWQC